MQMTAVYSCVRILSEAIAGLPVHLYRYDGSGGKEKATDHPLYFILHDEPNPEMTSFVFRETLMTHLLLWGNAYAQIIRNGKGEVVALYPLMPNRMTVDRDADGHLYYEYQTSQDEAHTMDGSRIRLLPSDVLHIPGLGFDGLMGYSPIAMAKNAIGMAIACEEYGAKFFANGATPGGILEHPGVVKDPERVRESWNSAFGGSANANKVAVLEEGMKYTPISISPEQAQFLETRKFQINEIARIFRIPPHMIGDLEKSSFSNIEQQSLEFVKYTLDPWVCRWEQSMQRALLSMDEKKEYFSSKIRCGECGSWYGSKVWHSTDKYRRVIWQCNHKYDGGKHCGTPHLTDEQIQDAFLSAANKLLADKDAVIANGREMMALLFDTSEKEAERDKLLEEAQVVSDAVQQNIYENAHVALDQKTYQKKYDDLTARYETLKTRIEDLNEQISQTQSQKGSVEDFLTAFEKLPETLTAFSLDAFNALTDYLTVSGEGDIDVTFRNGQTIKA